MTLRKRFRVWYVASLVTCTTIICLHAYREMTRDHNIYNKGRTKEIVTFSLGLALPMALLGLAGGWWLSRRSLDELQALTEVASRTDVDNLAEAIPRSGNGDEFDKLTQVFNEMRTRLQTSFLQVRQFTLAASHELKTPLAIMRAEVETALQSLPEQDSTQRQWMENLVDEVDRMARIVDQLTFLSKADTGMIKLEIQPVNLTALVHDAMEDAQTLASTNHITVTCQADPNVIVPADPSRLRQLLLNLVDNAVKYNVPGGTISILLASSLAGVNLIIRNTGVPLPLDQQARVFDRFFRGDYHEGRDVEGSGLGLNIVRWIVASHAGTVTFQCDATGLTTLHVILPPAV